MAKRGSSKWGTGYVQRAVRVEVDPEEKREIEEAAEEQGESVSNYLRGRLGLSRKRRGRRRKSETQEREGEQESGEE